MISDKHSRQYILRLNKWMKDRSREPEHKVYEILWALKKDMILWDDIPPDFCEKYNIPHRRDYGIDLISEDNTKTGQVKHYHENSVISWNKISTYFNYNKYLGIPDKNTYILTTREAKVDSMVQSYINKFNIHLERETFDNLLEVVKPGSESYKEIDNDASFGDIQIQTREFILDCVSKLNNNKSTFRFQLPCGVGKSFIMFYIIKEELKKNKMEVFFIFCPWIQLAEQHAKILNKLGIKNQVIGNGKTKLNKTANVVICIYPSSKYLKEKICKYRFIDEAHRLENEDSKYRQIINETICEKEIQLSATFKNQEDLDYIMPLREAIEKGYITDYKVVIEYFTNGNKDNSLIDLITKRPEWFPAFIYFNSIERAKMFSSKLKEKGVGAVHVSAETGIENQQKIIQQIETNEIEVVCLVGCWNEGTSVNNVRTVILGDMRYSSINRIQIIMRASRLYHDKPFYNVVIPLVKNNLEEEDECHEDLCDFISTLVKIDPKLKEFIKKNSNSSRIKIGIDGLYKNKEDEEGDDDDKYNEEAIHISELIFDSLGNMMGRLTLDEKIVEFIQYVKDNGRLPTYKKEIRFSDGVLIDKWFGEIKRNMRKLSETYNKLAVNTIIKTELDRYLKEKENKPINLLPKDKKIVEFIEYVEKNGIPSGASKNKFSDDTIMGKWFHFTIKKKIVKESETYKKLAVNEIIKKEMDRYLEEKRIKPWGDNKQLNLDEKCNEFLQYVEKNGIPPQTSKNKFSDNVLIGIWFYHIKEKLIKDSDIYNKLSINVIIKEEMDKYLEDKNIKPLNLDDICDEFIKYVEKSGIPLTTSKNKFTNGLNIINWFTKIKENIAKDSELYKKLAVNETIKEKMDKYLEEKDIKPLNLDEKCDEFIKYVEKSGIPSATSKNKFSDGTFIAKWFHGTVKQRNILTVYKKLAVNEIIKTELDRYIEEKENKPWGDNKQLNLDEKCNEFLQYVEKNGIPPQTSKNKFSDDTKMGYWFQGVKNKKLDKESDLYKKLAVNEIIKTKMDRYLEEKEKKIKHI